MGRRKNTSETEQMGAEVQPEAEAQPTEQPEVEVQPEAEAQAETEQPAAAPEPKAKRAKKEEPSKKAQALSVTSKKPHFFRCGRRFTHTPTVISLSEISAEDAQRLQDEPQLNAFLVDA